MKTDELIQRLKLSPIDPYYLTGEQKREIIERLEENDWLIKENDRLNKKIFEKEGD